MVVMEPEPQQERQPCGLKCANCGGVLASVGRTIPSDGFKLRERVCPACGSTNVTSERVIHSRPRVQ